MTDTSPRQSVYVTSKTGKVHIKACPHLHKNSTLIEPTPEQIEAPFQKFIFDFH